MNNLKNKLYDFKDRLRKGKMLTVTITLIIIILIMMVFSLKKAKDYRLLAENSYNEAFYELSEYINNTEKLLAKAEITNDNKHASKILTSIWKTASIAEVYLSRLPIESQNLEQAQKFLNQVSDYSYSLSSKTISGEKLSQNDLDKISELHQYSVDLENTINQIENDLYSNNVKWGELTKKGSKIFANGDENLSKTTFSNIEEDLHQYTGLIYDGAFSENHSIYKGFGLTGEDVNKENAKNIAINFIGKDKVSEVTSENETQNSNVNCFEFQVSYINGSKGNVIVTKKGGHILSFNCDRQVTDKNISEADAISIGKEFLKNNNLGSMKETYYLSNENILTINYAYYQDNVTIYPDLIKVKIAMDNGEVLGMEATNYLNNHIENREFKNYKISQEEAKKLVSNKVQINSIDKAVIPTEYNTEINCYEIKGKIEDNDFLIFINGETGEEEDILMIVNTPNGTLTE